MTINSRRKGHSFEREIAQRYRDAFPGCMVRRGQQGDGAVEPDVVGPPWLWTECKRGRMPNIRAAMRQAQKDNVHDSKHNVVVTKADRDEPLVTMTLDSFLELMGQLWKETK